MIIDVVFLPHDFRPAHREGKIVVVFDVLRATTTLTAALAAGVSEIRIFETLDAAKTAADAYGKPRLLCGEVKCLAPRGFDLGNSPGQFTRELHAGQTAFMSTTNGTRALVCAIGAERIFVGAPVNAAAVADKISSLNRDVTLLCAGTNGAISMDDIIGAGAVIDAVRNARFASDAARAALRLFRSARDDLRGALAESTSGHNVANAGLSEDIDFAAMLDRFDIVGEFLTDAPPRVVASK